MSPVTSVFTFLPDCSQGFTNIHAYPLDLNVVYLNETASSWMPLKAQWPHVSVKWRLFLIADTSLVTFYRIFVQTFWTLQSKTIQVSFFLIGLNVCLTLRIGRMVPVSGDKNTLYPLKNESASDRQTHLGFWLIVCSSKFFCLDSFAHIDKNAQKMAKQAPNNRPTELPWQLADYLSAKTQFCEKRW